MITIQHHYAHILSCIAEHQLRAPALGIAWDGTGYGTDETLWGGEFLKVTEPANEQSAPQTVRQTVQQSIEQRTEQTIEQKIEQILDPGFERVAHFLPYYLPGAEACSLEPRRSALGLLYRCYGEAAFEMTDLPPMQAFTKPQLVVIRKMLTQKISTPVTSSMGRMFDGVAALLNLHHYVSFEGQAALTLEFAATQSPVKGSYPFILSETQPSVIDWRPMIRTIVEDCRNAVMAPVMAAKFHNTLVDIIVAVAKRAGCPQVVMSGGCFQNTVLIERAIRRLSAEGFTPYWPKRVPPNDGGLAVGQVLAAWRYLAHTD